MLSINSADDSFLRRIYTEDNFNYTPTTANQINYNLLESQNLIVLNELNTLPNALITALKQFTNEGGVLMLIPSKGINSASY